MNYFLTGFVVPDFILGARFSTSYRLMNVKTKIKSIQMVTALCTGLIAIGMGGCAKDPPAAPVPAGSAPPADASGQAAPAAPENPLEPRYDSTLADGIKFGQNGYPNFVSGVEGISGAEQWGRWTDSNLNKSAVIKLATPVNGEATVRLKARDFFGINAGQKIPVKFGDQTQEFEFSGSDDQTFTLKFTGLKSADTIEITPGKTSEPKPEDARRMGIGLIELGITQ